VNNQRARRLQVAAGVLLGVVAIAVIAIAVASGGGNGKPRVQGAARIANVAIPAAADKNLRAAAAAAGCVLLHPPSEGRLHVLGNVVYHTNPPSSGPHYPVPAHDGIYEPGSTPVKEQLVHSLEHGRIEVQYAPELPEEDQLALKGVFDESPSGMLLFPNADMPYEVAATAWTQLLGCKRYEGSKTLDAIRNFRDQFRGRGPEGQIPVSP
jgi:Protein of unknown function (DUF3105)